MGFTDVLEFTLSSTTMSQWGDRQRMKLNEPTSCPKWFPFFLVGVGCVGLFARQILV